MMSKTYNWIKYTFRLIFFIFFINSILLGQNTEENIRNQNAIEDANDQIPITPYEIISRMKDIPEILKWSMRKHLIVSGPYFWGIHHIYIDDNLRHVVICLKDDRTSHVFIGDESNAMKWRKYDDHFNLLFENDLDDGSLEWKIYKDLVLYKGNMLPPKEIPEEPYWGTLIGDEEFDKEMSDSMIVKTIHDLFN